MYMSEIPKDNEVDPQQQNSERAVPGSIFQQARGAYEKVVASNEGHPIDVGFLQLAFERMGLTVTPDRNPFTIEGITFRYAGTRFPIGKLYEGESGPYIETQDGTRTNRGVMHLDQGKIFLTVEAGGKRSKPFEGSSAENLGRALREIGA